MNRAWPASGEAVVAGEAGEDSADLADRRVDRLAHLAAQIAAVEKRAPEPSTVGPQRRQTRHAGDGADRSVVGGSGSGSRRGSRREPGGHPEDSPGDPEVVAKAICLRLLTIAPRPRAGLAQALARKGIPEEVAQRVLDRLTEVGLIDDAAYAASFVRTKARDRGLGRLALRTELQRLGVDEDSTGQALAQVDDDAEVGRAQALIAKRLDSAMSAGAVAARRRLLAMLARRGYSADLSTRLIEAAIGEYERRCT